MENYEIKTILYGHGKAILFCCIIYIFYRYLSRSTAYRYIDICEWQTIGILVHHYSFRLGAVVSLVIL